MVDRTPRPQSQVARSREGDKALIVALSYSDEPEESSIHPLKTTIRDAHGFAALLEEKGYLKRNITVMTDKTSDPAMLPTRDNLLRELDNFTRGVRPGDRRVFSFSGHGFQIVSRTLEEDDGMDEVILLHGHHGPPFDKYGKPLDRSKMFPDDPDWVKLEGIITDNELHELLVKRLARTGSRVIAIFDTCHSGTMLDLNYHWKYMNSQYVTVPSPLVGSPKAPGLKLIGSPPARKNSLPKAAPAEDRVLNESGTMRFTMSPEQKNRPLFDEPDDPRTDVYSLASSEDAQTTYDMQGVSMLSTLTQILRDQGESNLTIRELMVELQCRLHKTRRSAFLSSEIVKRQSPNFVVKMTRTLKKLQFPQFGSQTRSAPHKRFSL